MQSRPPLRYHGGKWRLAPWIVSHFPAHRVYVEPYGGGASVLLRKGRSYAEVYNDLDSSIVRFFRTIRERGDEVARAVATTPFARDEFLGAYAETEDDVEAARRLCVLSHMGFGSAAVNRDHRTGFRANSNRSGTTPAHDWANYPPTIVATMERLQGVVMENREAPRVMLAHDGAETLHYVDPPYVPETRGKGQVGNYRHEMTVEDHERLLETLLSLSGMVVLSGYASSLYDDALGDWRRVEREASANGNVGGTKRTEVLWLSPRCAPNLFSDPTP